MLDDRYAESNAIFGVAHGRFESSAGHADALRGDADAPGFEVGEGDPVAFAFLAEQR